MEDFINNVINLIESYCILNIITGNDVKCETIVKDDDLIVILYKNLRITIMSDSFVFISVKLKQRLGKRALNKICSGLCCNINHKPCLYNGQEIINIITLVNITEKRKEIYKILDFILNLI
jgi:uncharacterized protein YuzB (UPF0349 family)